jgi:hypothetical protein
VVSSLEILLSCDILYAAVLFGKVVGSSPTTTHMSVELNVFKYS